VTALTEHGATARATPTDAVAAAEIVVTMLPNADAVADVMLRDGTLDALRANTTWAQMGTIGFEATERLAAEVARRRPDVMFVDAPVSGSREPARNGRLLILASGPDRSHDSVDAVFAALGQRTLWLGRAGTASRLKLVLNAWLAFEIEAAAEASALAERLGVPYAVLADAVVGGPLASATASAKLAKMERGDYSADFSLEWAQRPRRWSWRSRSAGAASLRKAMDISTSAPRDSDWILDRKRTTPGFGHPYECMTIPMDDGRRGARFLRSCSHQKEVSFHDDQEQTDTVLRHGRAVVFRRRACPDAGESGHWLVHQRPGVGDAAEHEQRRLDRYDR